MVVSEGEKDGCRASAGWPSWVESIWGRERLWGRT